MYKILFENKVVISSVKRKGKDQPGVIFADNLRSGISAAEKQLLSSDISTEQALEKVNDIVTAAKLVDGVDIIWQARLKGHNVVITAWKVIKFVDGEYRLKSANGKYCRISPAKIGTVGYNTAWSTNVDRAAELLYSYCNKRTRTTAKKSRVYNSSDYNRMLHTLDLFMFRDYNCSVTNPCYDGILIADIKVITEKVVS